MSSLLNAFSLTNKIALVTGGASGIGEGICCALAEMGARVVVADVNFELAEQVAKTIAEQGGHAAPLALDVGDESSVLEAVSWLERTLGTPWALVNNAGVQDRENFLESHTSEWDRMQSVNARGPYMLTREISKLMAAAGEGRVINIASAALSGGIVKGLVSYAGSKGALLGLSIATAYELAELGITVNTILPGGVPTPGARNAKGPFTGGPATRKPPFGLCQPSDIAAAVCYFASPAAGRVTNQVLAVDGGHSVT